MGQVGAGPLGLALAMLLGACQAPLPQADPYAPDKLPALLDSLPNPSTADQASVDQQKSALDVLDRILKEQPECYPALERRAELHLAWAKPAGAVADADRLIGAYGPEPRTLAIKGMAHYKLNQKGRAIKAFRGALDLDPRNVDAMIHLGLLLGQHKRFVEARRYLSRAKRIDPNNPQIAEYLGLIEGMAKPDGEAPAGTASTSDPSLLKKSGLFLLSSGQHKKGTTLLLRALAGRPDDRSILLAAANGFEAQGMDKQAAVLQRKAVRLDKDDMIATRRLAQVTLRLGSNNKAAAAESADLFERLLKQDPDDLDARIGAAKAQAHAGRPSEAAFHYQHALKANGAPVDVYNDYAAFLMKAGQIDHALDVIEAGLKQHQANPYLEANWMAAQYRLGRVEQGQEMRDRLLARKDLPERVRSVVKRYKPGSGS